MSAREDILGRVRAALSDAPKTPAVTVPRRTPDPAVDLVALFCERVADYRAVVERCSADELADRAPAALPDGRASSYLQDLDLEVPRSLVD